jgi:pimeloyl-ACP methyl ester carboxylesterase
MAERVERDGVGEWLVDAMLPNLLSPNASPEARELTRTMILEQRPEDVAWWQRAMAKRPDSADVLGKADVPALVIAGELDPIMPPEVTRQLADVLPRSTFVEMPGVAHLPPVEQPEQFRDELERWLTSAVR